MIVLNGEPFIKYNLESIYPYAHEILIVEGAVEKFRHAATLDGHSVDKTVEIIRDFPDPQGKIKLIQRNGFWSEKDEMSNAYLEVCTGDYIWQVDVDEFYKSDDIEKVRRLLAENPDIERVDIKTINFWRGFRAVMQGGPYIYSKDDFIRIFRFKPGYRYQTHRPPTIIDKFNHVIGTRRILYAKELAEVHKVFIYHYSYVFPEGVKSKSDYYARMGWGGGCEDGLKWAEACWEKLNNPLRIHLIKFPPSWIIPFEGNHPDVIEEMKKEINFAEDCYVEDFLAHEWTKYAAVGKKITEYYMDAKKNRISKVKAAMSILGSIFFPSSKKSLRADKTILEVFAKSLIL